MGVTFSDCGCRADFCRPIWEAAINLNRNLTKRLTIAYVAGLAFIGILSATVHVLLDRVIVQQHDTGTVINVAGRQRMLSQRIALLATDTRSGIAGAEEELRGATALMAQSHDALINGGQMGIDKPLSAAGRAYYFTGADPLDEAVRTFLQTVRTFLADPTDDAAFRDLDRMARLTLLPRLDGAVRLFETQSNERIAWLSLAQKVVLCTLLLTLLLEALLIFRPLVIKVQEHAQTLYDLAHLDELTGLANRRSFIEQATRAVKDAQTQGGSVALILLDLDHFKRINDTYGHATGDTVLQRFAWLSRHGLRTSEMVGRLGGEEFAILLTSADLQSALIVAEKLRRIIAEDETGHTPAFTISIGVAALEPGDTSVEDLIRRADHWLYAAKRNGRNRVASPLPARGRPAPAV